MLLVITRSLCKILLVIVPVMMLADMAHAADRFLSIAAFQKKDLAYQYDPLLSGNYTQLLSQLEQDNYLLFLNRTVKVKDRDVINLQSDVLRMQNGQLANGGIDCHFSFDNETTADSSFYSLSGMCYIMHATDGGGTERRSVLIKRTMLSDPDYGGNLWMKLYEDKETGIAIFADVD